MTLETLMDPEAFFRTLWGCPRSFSGWRKVEGTWLRGRGSGVPLWYIHCLSFVHPCGIWVCSLPVVGPCVNTQYKPNVSEMDTLIIPFTVLV